MGLLMTRKSQRLNRGHEEQRRPKDETDDDVPQRASTRRWGARTSRNPSPTI